MEIEICFLYKGVSYSWEPGVLILSLAFDIPTVIKLGMIILWGKIFCKFSKTIHEVVTIVLLAQLLQDHIRWDI